MDKYKAILGTLTFKKGGSTLKKYILAAILMFGLCMMFSSFVWAGDDLLTEKTRSACQDGNSAACFQMGDRYRVIEKDNKTAIEFYRRACDADYMTGCLFGGNLLFMAGAHGSAKWKEAKKMYQKACDADEDAACYMFGNITYKEGRQKKAIKYYKQACKMGNQGGCAKSKRLSR